MSDSFGPIEQAIPSHPHHRSGWIEVICGPMFSGKTEELIRRLRRAQIARQPVAIFKPVLDNRFSTDHLVSHSDITMRSKTVSTAAEILDQVGDAQVLGIDEAQFFGSDLVAVCRYLADHGKRVIIAGLDQDYRGVPFEPVPELLAEAEYITKTLAICVKCGAPANRSQRISSSSERVLVGAQDRYEARCRACFEAPE
ncbi:MAG: thymidine kinase [bacterium]|nr:thymidine kinase [bacterium]